MRHSIRVGAVGGVSLGSIARLWTWALLFCMLAIPAIGLAQVPSSASSAEPAPATSAEAIPWQPGPKQIDLGHELGLDLTERFAFLEREPAAKLLEKNGGVYNENLLGLVIGTQPEDDWFVVIRYDEEGYIKDDEAVDADEILKAIREGQEEVNKERQKRGFEPLTIDGWQEPPHYEKANHRMVWGLNVGDKAGSSVNYNTRILGRKGYASLNLVTEPAKLPAHKPMAAELLTKTAFRAGARYEDFNQSTDKVAEYGLGGLVLAGAGLTAAKLVKIGLLAKFWKIILVALMAGKKFIVVALIALGALIKSFFSRKKNEPSES